MATLGLGNVWVNTNEVLLWSPHKHVLQSSALDDSKWCSCMRDSASERVREGESESAIGRKSLHSHIGYPQYRRARWAAARARAEWWTDDESTRIGHYRTDKPWKIFLFSLLYTDSCGLRAEVLEDAVVWNWTFRDAVSPVRSSTGSGFPIVRKERTLLSDVRNHHQPSCALLFYDVTLFAANLLDSTC